MVVILRMLALPMPEQINRTESRLGRVVAAFLYLTCLPDADTYALTAHLQNTLSKARAHTLCPSSIFDSDVPIEFFAPRSDTNLLIFNIH